MLSRPEFQALLSSSQLRYFCEGVGNCFLFIVPSPGQKKTTLKQAHCMERSWGLLSLWYRGRSPRLDIWASWKIQGSIEDGGGPGVMGELKVGPPFPLPTAHLSLWKDSPGRANGAGEVFCSKCPVLVETWGWACEGCHPWELTYLVSAS